MYSSVEELVRKAYPAHAWEHERFIASARGAKTQYAPQSFLMRIVRSIFPGVHVEMNVRTELIRTDTNSRTDLEIDVFLPELQLGFEYQVKKC